MKEPDQEILYGVLDATWAPARFVDCGPWCLREGRGGGQRVSAATAKTPVSETDIDTAEAGMRDLDQRPIFMIRPGDAELDQWLEARGYAVNDPVTIYLCPAKTLAKPLTVTASTPSWPPMAVAREIWQRAGIGPARLDVMVRSPAVRTTLLGRAGDTPAGVAYVGIKGDIAMLHALEVLPDHRRAGVARALLHGAANWALSQNAAWLSLIVTRANVPANALYRSLGMATLPGYHYRVASGETQ